MSSRKILLADDDQDMHVLMKKYFPEPDYELISSFDGEQAYELIKEKKPEKPAPKESPRQIAAREQRSSSQHDHEQRTDSVVP